MRLLEDDRLAGVGNLLEKAALSENRGVLGSGGANLTGLLLVLLAGRGPDSEVPTLL